MGNRSKRPGLLMSRGMSAPGAVALVAPYGFWRIERCQSIRISQRAAVERGRPGLRVVTAPIRHSRRRSQTIRTRMRRRRRVLAWREEFWRFCSAHVRLRGNRPATCAACGQTGRRPAPPRQRRGRGSGLGHGQRGGHPDAERSSLPVPGRRLAIASQPRSRGTIFRDFTAGPWRRKTCTAAAADMTVARCRQPPFRRLRPGSGGIPSRAF